MIFILPSILVSFLRPPFSPRIIQLVQDTRTSPKAPSTPGRMLSAVFVPAVMLFKYPSASLRRRGRTTFPRAHIVRIAAVAPEYPVILGEIKVEEPATIAVEYRIGSRCALPIKH